MTTLMLSDFSKAKAEKFAAWLSCRGAEVLPGTNPYEVIRFRHAAGTGVIYANASGRSFKANTADAVDAWECFREGRTWRNRIAGNKRNVSKAFKQLIARDGNCCFYCGKQLMPEQMTEEHLLSLIHGGNNRLENKALACKPCNQEAGNKPLIEKILLWDSKRALREKAGKE